MDYDVLFKRLDAIYDTARQPWQAGFKNVSEFHKTVRAMVDAIQELGAIAPGDIAEWAEEKGHDTETVVFLTDMSETVAATLRHLNIPIPR